MRPKVLSKLSKPLNLESPMPFVLYFHGFNSAPSPDGKAYRISQHLQIPVHQLKMDYHKIGWIEQITQEVQDWVATGECLGLMGTSLGGFTAEYFHRITQLPTLVFNPATYPSQSCAKYFGPQTNMVTGEQYTFGPEHLEELLRIEALRAQRPVHQPQRLAAFFGSLDTVLDPIQGQETYRQMGYTQFEIYPDDHNFTEHFGQVLESNLFAKLFP
jgi:uncharacterized protein